MRAPASDMRPTSWARRIVSWIFAAVTAGYRIRLDYPDGQQFFLGPAERPLDVGVRPPTIWQTLWIFLRPGARTGESYMRGYWDITQGDLATFILIIQVPRPG